MTPSRQPPARRLAAVAALLVLTLWSRPAAHEIATDLPVHVFFRAEENHARLLIRLPLRALRDVVIPQRGPGYLDLARADATLRDAAPLWIADYVELYEGDRPLGSPRLVAARVSRPSDTCFHSYEAALRCLTGPALPADTALYWEEGVLDVSFEYPIQSDRSEFSIHPNLPQLGVRVQTVLRFAAPGGTERAFDLHGDPGLVRLDPRWHHAARRFVADGFLHILDGTDHLLFLLCLVIPFRRVRALVAVVTSFTVAHSITLIASAYGLAPDAAWFPPLVEIVIAVSIFYMALENIVAPQLERRWVIAFAFGLVHGFGFSFALRDTLQFAGSHLLTSLVSFNVGVELGQLLVLVVLTPALALLFDMWWPSEWG